MTWVLQSTSVEWFVVTVQDVVWQEAQGDLAEESVRKRRKNVIAAWTKP